MKAPALTDPPRLSTKQWCSDQWYNAGFAACSQTLPLLYFPLMKILTRYIIKEHLPPFFMAIGVLTFLFLANFVVKSIDKLLGKGLSLWVILEFIFLNLMWILALSIPMAVLVSILMSYGRLSADNEINAMRTSGISFWSIVKPSLLFGLVVCLGMIYFNNYILPDFNHRARLLGSDISRKQPDIHIEPGYFIDDLPQYSLLVHDKEEGILEDILIYSKGNRESQTTIKAKQGSLSIEGDQIVMTLYNGEIHELQTKKLAEYRRIDFQKHILTIPASNLVLRRHESGRRGDREMSAGMMLERVEEFRDKRADARETITSALEDRIGLDIAPTNGHRLREVIELQPDSIIAIRTDSLAQEPGAHRKLRQDIQVGQQRIKTQLNRIESFERQINKYLSEVHKKYSIPVACIVFVLIGAPLGIMARHGGLAVGAGFSLFFFLIYWAGLIGGEELADRLIISPWIAMWTPNIVVGFVGIWLTINTVRERSTLDWNWLTRIRRRRQTEQ